MTYDDFFNIVDIEDKDKDSAIFFMKNRGIEENINVANYLQSYKSNKVTYSEVATTFRYDKRIRRIVYKYMGYIEETIRAYLSNKYEKISYLPEKAQKIISPAAFKHSLNKDSTNEVLSNTLFSNLFEVLEASTKGKHPEGLPIIDKYLIKNREALVALRNKISHNNFLLNNRQLKEVTLSNGHIGCTLLDNLRNMCSFLPEKVSDSFVDEINNARYKKSKSNKLAVQVSWDLPKNIILNLSNK